MRLTIRTKLGLGMGIISSIFIIVGLTTYLQIQFIDKRIREITEVEDPTHTAAYEMEINAIGTGMGVLKYLDTSDPRYRKRVEEEAVEFKEFHAHYLRLAETPKENELGKHLDNLFEEYRVLGMSLMKKKDDQNTLFERVALTFEKMDDIIDDKIQAKIDKKGPDGLQKLWKSTDMEGDIAEVGSWLGNYLNTRKKRYKKRIYYDVNEFKEEFIQFQKLRLTEEEKHWAAKLETLFNQGISDIGQIVTLNDYLHKKILKFIDLRIRIDNLLDDEIQILTEKDLNLIKKEAHRAADRAVNVLFGLIICGILFGTFAGWRIAKSITEPVDKLVSATEVISKGDLSHRIDIRSKDEFEDLAESFNHMVNDLARTMEFNTKLLDSSPTPIIVINPDTSIRYINKQLERLTCFSSKELIGTKTPYPFWRQDKINKIKNDINEAMQRGAKSLEEPFQDKNGKHLWVEISSIPILHDDKLDFYLASWIDITDRKQKEEKIQASLKEKKVLLQEIHHRVKNNMQVISSLLRIQASYIKDERVTNALLDCQGRVQAMAFVHETLYSSGRLSVIDFKAYITRLADKMLRANSSTTKMIKINVDAEDIKLRIEQATPLGLIVNELISNSLKYAFPKNQHGEIFINLRVVEQDTVEFIFTNNGTAIPDDFDWRNTDSLGLQLIILLAEDQLDGTVNLNRDKDTRFTIKFRLEENK